MNEGLPYLKLSLDGLAVEKSNQFERHDKSEQIKAEFFRFIRSA